jgi:hypothetical protein
MTDPITVKVWDAFEICYYVANGITFDGIKDTDKDGYFLCRFILTDEKQVRVVQVLQSNLKTYGGTLRIADLRLEMRGIQEKMTADLKRLNRSRKRRVAV